MQFHGLIGCSPVICTEHINYLTFMPRGCAVSGTGSTSHTVYMFNRWSDSLTAAAVMCTRKMSAVLKTVLYALCSPQQISTSSTHRIPCAPPRAAGRTRTTCSSPPCRTAPSRRTLKRRSPGITDKWSAAHPFWFAENSFQNGKPLKEYEGNWKKVWMGCNSAEISPQGHGCQERNYARREPPPRGRRLRHPVTGEETLEGIDASRPEITSQKYWYIFCWISFLNYVRYYAAFPQKCGMYFV